MMPRTDVDALPSTVQQELHRVTALLFEAFAETMKGRLAEQYREGRILALILHGPSVERERDVGPPGEAFPLMAIVNYPRLARSEQDWRMVRDRLRRAWEHGEIAHPVQLAVHSHERVNRALIDGDPHFVSVVEQGIALYATGGLRLKSPRRVPEEERRVREQAAFARWFDRANDFLLGAGFYRDQEKGPMAALLLHQACEHFYQSLLWLVTLHGPRSHALDELRGAAEALDARLIAAWPRETAFERRAFGCVRRAYVEARYGHCYRITQQELAWAMERATMLRDLIGGIHQERLAGGSNEIASCLITSP